MNILEKTAQTIPTETSAVASPAFSGFVPMVSGYVPSKRHVCTANSPWKEGMGPAKHPDAVESGEQQPGWPSGDVQGYKCPHCGKYFEVELPQ